MDEYEDIIKRLQDQKLEIKECELLLESSLNMLRVGFRHILEKLAELKEECKEGYPHHTTPIVDYLQKFLTDLNRVVEQSMKGVSHSNVG